MLNTVRLLKGEAILTKSEVKNFHKYDTIWGDDGYPKELKKWNIKDKEEAKRELSKYRCKYDMGNPLSHITEYGLEYYEEDEDGNFITGSDYDFAEDEVLQGD